jgi:HD superfamily phosphohydrolase
MALVAHFAPQDQTARAAALLHDIGHLPFSHTFEGLAGLNHHELGRERIISMEEILLRHGLTSEGVIAVEEGTTESLLHSAAGQLRLDHLDSFLRSGQAHGRTRTTPATMLRQLRLINGTVDTDPDTARELFALIVGEACAQRSSVNIISYAVVRKLAESLLERQDAMVVAAMTDDEFWSVLAADTNVGGQAAEFRRLPHDWISESLTQEEAAAALEAGETAHTIHRSYLDLPTVYGKPLSPPMEIEALGGGLPLHHRVRQVKADTRVINVGDTLKAAS